MDNGLTYKFKRPNPSLVDFVDRFSFLQNLSSFKDGIIIPNGRIDLLFYKTADDQFHITLMGLETKAKQMPEQEIPAFFAISFNPIAIEYVLHQSVAGFVNSGKHLPNNFWNFSIADLNNFEAFCEKATSKILSLLPEEIDERKRKLFELIFLANGEINVKELSDQVNWSERQINRYFNHQLGISLKVYCNILRFQASLSHIKNGYLYPQLNFTDQSHFIKEIKKLSGVSPKELFKNQNDRFLQFLVTDPE
ncbi:MAG: AraC family transcriptional regulator [Pedobacter sp.]|nr:MAG: AraC family transcriptional regulator [Pedobacter sp.]